MIWLRPSLLTTGKDDGEADRDGKQKDQEAGEVHDERLSTMLELQEDESLGQTGLGRANREEEDDRPDEDVPRVVGVSCVVVCFREYKREESSQPLKREKTVPTVGQCSNQYISCSPAKSRVIKTSYPFMC